MSLRINRLLNRVLPVGMKNIGRHLAVAFIPTMRHLDLPTRLRHLKTLGINPKCVLDIGAASGEWAVFVHGIWPEARIYGFEPNAREIPQLEETKRAIPQFDYFRGFLGPEAKVVTYTDSNTQTSLFAQGKAGPAVEAPMYVLDTLLAEGKILQPQLIKLDVQGFELEVLKGASTLLKEVEVAVLEVSFAPFHPGMPVVNDVVEFMKARGFVWYDIISALRRAGDDRLMQIDAVFVRQGHALLDDKWD